jgi:hypothetical protein
MANERSLRDCRPAESHGEGAGPAPEGGATSTDDPKVPHPEPEQEESGDSIFGHPLFSGRMFGSGN